MTGMVVTSFGVVVEGGDSGDRLALLALVV